MKAVILAGGYGTRLRPLSCTRPKLLLPVANRPLIDWTVEHLRKSGIKSVILAVGHMADDIKRHLKTVRGVNFHYSLETRALGTGGAIKNAERFVGRKETFLVVNGDIITFPDYKKIVSFHSEGGHLATVAVYEVEKPERFGAVVIDRDGKVKEFVEKPPHRITNLINAGIYVLEPEVFDYIHGGKVSMERDVFPILCEKGLMGGFQLDGPWMDMGLMEDYFNANELLMGKVRVRVAKSAKIGRGSKIGENVVIGKEAKVMGGAIIKGPTAIGDRVSVGKDVRIRNSIILEGAKINDHAAMERTVVGGGVVIGKRVKIERGCVIGDKVVIGDHVTLAPEVRICPYKEVLESVLEPGLVVT